MSDSPLYPPEEGLEATTLGVQVYDQLSGVPPWLEPHAAPGAFPAPVMTRQQVLPFHRLEWENFERLCLAVSRLESSVEQTRVYGAKGQDQQGIDLFARLNDESGAYAVYQCRRVVKVTRAAIRSAVNGFLGGTWRPRSRKFVLCIAHSIIRTELVEEAERQARRLATQSIAFELWDGEALSQRLKGEPEIVEDFFSPEWVRAFCGEAEAAALTARRSVAVQAVHEHNADVRAEIARIAAGLTVGAPAAPVRLPSEEALWRRLIAAHYPVIGSLRGRRDQLIGERQHAHDQLLRRAARMEITKRIPPGILGGGVGLRFTATRCVPRDIRVTPRGDSAMVEYGPPWSYYPAFAAQLLADDPELPVRIRSAVLHIPQWRESVRYSALDDELAQTDRLLADAVAAARTASDVPGVCDSCPARGTTRHESASGMR